MTVNNLKKLLIGKIAETSDEELLKVVYRLLENCNDVHQLSPEEINIVKEAQAEYKRGEIITDEELQKEFDKRLKD
jgi:hypothetical protein